MLFIFLLLTISVIFISFIPKKEIKLLQNVGSFTSGLVLILSCSLLSQYNSIDSNFQFVINFLFLKFDYLNFNAYFGLDGISIYFFLLTSFLVFLCVIFIWKEENIKDYLIFFFLL
jgi:NADH:ubiquinone oxidoreductase subunit 4 (subunit M)